LANDGTYVLNKTVSEHQLKKNYCTNLLL